MRKMWRGNLLRPVIQRFFTGSRKWPHTFSHVSSSCTSHGESLSGCATSLRPKSNGWLECSAVWCIFMNNTLQAAVHLGRNCLENSRFTENQLLQSVKQLFQVIENLVKDQKEINSLTTIDFKDPTWRSTTLLCDKAFEITNAKNLCLRRLGAQSGKHQWKTIRSLDEQKCMVFGKRYVKDLNRIDEEPMEFEWTMFPWFTTLGILEEVHKFYDSITGLNQSSSKNRIIFMSMFNDIVWREQCETNSG